MFYSNSNSQRFQIYAGKMNAKRPTCPVGSIPSKAGTPQDRVWGHTRAKIFHCNVVAVTRAGVHAHAIIPVGTTVSVHGWLPSPFRVVTHITLYCSRRRGICQGNRGFVYNSFTCMGINARKKRLFRKEKRDRGLGARDYRKRRCPRLSPCLDFHYITAGTVCQGFSWNRG